MNQELSLQYIQTFILNLPNHPSFLLDQSLAIVYETETKYINRAVKRNPKRFPDDFCFQLTDQEVETLRCQNGTTISSMARSNPYGFSREGANMLSVVLHTNIAIERSVQIIRAFSAMERLQYGILLTIAEQFETHKKIARTAGLTGNQAILAASTAVKKLTGIDPLEIIEQKQLISESQEIFLTPTAIGKMLKISSQKANKLLEESGMQVSLRDAKNKKCWEPTEKAKPFAVIMDTNKKHSDGRPVQQLMWRESILEILKKQTLF